MNAWSASEIRILAGAVLALRDGAYVPWGAVSARVRSRTAAQCSAKWNGSFGARTDGVPWGARRDLALVNAV